MPEPKDILDRWEAMTQRRAAWDPLWQELLDFFLPARTPLMGEQGRGRQRTDRRFDSTGSHFMSRLASTLQQLQVNPAEQWFNIAPIGVPDNQELEEWLDASAEALYDALRRSNFYSEMGCAYEDLTCLSTTSVFVDELPIRRDGFNGFIFRTLAPGEYAIDENDLGEVDTYGRRLKLTPRQAVLKFGEDRVSDDIKTALKGKETGQEFEFVHLVYRRDDPLLGGERPNPRDRSVRGMEWSSVYVDKKAEKIVLEGGFRDQRYFAARWKKSSGELYGRGPAMDALPDVKSLTTIVKYSLEGLILDVYPPWWIPNESILGNLRLLPGARNVYNPSVQGEIKPLTSQRNMRNAVLKEEQIRESIARAFLDDVFGLRQEGQITATEVLDRRERRQQVSSPTASRIERELLDPLLSTCWMMMFRAGAFGRPPGLLGQVDRLEIGFDGPLARSQKLGNTRAFQDAFAVVQPIIEGRPDVADNYDLDQIARDVPDDMGVPRKWLNDREDVQQARQIRARQAAEQQALEQGQEVARTAAEVGATG